MHMASTASGWEELFGQTNADLGIRYFNSANGGTFVNPNANDWDYGTGSPTLEW